MEICTHNIAKDYENRLREEREKYFSTAPQTNYASYFLLHKHPNRVLYQPIHYYCNATTNYHRLPHVVSCRQQGSDAHMLYYYAFIHFYKIICSTASACMGHHEFADEEDFFFPLKCKCNSSTTTTTHTSPLSLTHQLLTHANLYTQIKNGFMYTASTYLYTHGCSKLRKNMYHHNKLMHICIHTRMYNILFNTLA